MLHFNTKGWDAEEFIIKINICLNKKEGAILNQRPYNSG